MKSNPDISPDVRATWQVPAFKTPLWLGRQHPWCVVVPVINEGERIKSLLVRMAALKINTIADIIIVDGGSKDGSLELSFLQQIGVRGPVGQAQLEPPRSGHAHHMGTVGAGPGHGVRRPGGPRHGARRIDALVAVDGGVGDRGQRAGVFHDPAQEGAPPV